MVAPQKNAPTPAMLEWLEPSGLSGRRRLPLVVPTKGRAPAWREERPMAHSAEAGWSARPEPRELPARIAEMTMRKDTSQLRVRWVDSSCAVFFAVEFTMMTSFLMMSDSS